MSKFKVVEQYSKKENTKCWIGTTDITIESMLTFSILSIASEKDVELVRRDYRYMGEANIIVRNNNITFIESQNKPSFDTDAWSWFGEKVITKAFEEISRHQREATYEYIEQQLLPVIYKRDELIRLTKDQKIIDEVIELMDRIYSRIDSNGDFEYLLNLTNEILLCIVEDIYTAEKELFRNPFKPRLRRGDLLTTLLIY